MGTLNISSMDLRAVNAPVRRAATPKNKRPRFKSVPVSRTKKALMVFSAFGLMAVAFLIPPASEPVRQPAAIVTEGTDVPAAPVVEPQRLSSKDVAVSRVHFQGGIAPKSKALEPLSVSLPFAPSTVGDVTIAMQVLANYIQNGSAEQKAEARLRILEYRREHLNLALCDLIRTHETPGLAVFVELAVQDKVPGTVEALVERLNSKDRRVYAHGEMVGALSKFADNPKAEAQIDAMLAGNNADNRAQIWNGFTAKMPAKYVDIAFERVVNGEMDSDAAIQALARFGSDGQQAMSLAGRIEVKMGTSSEAVRLRLIDLISRLESNAAAPRLRTLASDLNPRIRAAAVRTLAANPENAELIVMALRNDSSDEVKEACLAGLGATTNKVVLYELITLLSHTTLRHSAKRALVFANNGTDLGWQDSEWMQWAEGRR